MKVADTYLMDDEDQPFFWLADTAWNAPLRGEQSEWQTYLETRARQGFTAIQFVATQWRGCHAPRYGPLYTEGASGLRLNEPAFAAMDSWVEMINAAGMVAVPVMLWANTPTCPGQALSEDACIVLGRHMLERWGARRVVWFLAGDADYAAPAVAERWKRIGRAVFSDAPDAVATMHPCGLSWIGDSFAREPWYSFVGIQSGHGKGERDLRFLLQGAYSTAWQRIRKPFINIEPNYEMATPYGTEESFTGYHVRRASYWSMLVAPAAGITYGNNPIWIWAQTAGEIAEGHGTWAGDPWRRGLDTEGIRSLTILRAFFQRLPWTELRPAPELLSQQPGATGLERFIAVAATPSLSWIVAYLPCGGTLRLERPPAAGGGAAWWVDPRTGEWIPYESWDPARGEALAPNSRDWVFVCGPAAPALNPKEGK